MEDQDQVAEAELDGKWSDQRPRKPEDDLVNYLKQVGGSVESALEQDEREALVRNVFEEIEHQEACLACNKRTSFILESFLKIAKVAQVLKMLTNLKRYFGFLCTDRQGSHVLQTLMTRTHQLLANGEDQTSEEDETDDNKNNNGKKELKELVMDLCKTIISNNIWIDLIYDPCGTHVIRSIICVVSQRDPKNVKQMLGSISTSLPTHRIDSEFNASLHSFLAAASKWQDKEVMDACCNDYASSVIQLLLMFCSSKHKAWKGLVSKILEESSVETTFQEMSRNKISSYVLQILVRECDKNMFDTLFYDKCFRGKLKMLCSDSIGNFIVQQGLLRLHTEEQFKATIDELEEEMVNSLLYGRIGVVWHLCQGFQHDLAKGLQSRLCRALIRGIKNKYKKQDGKATIQVFLEPTARANQEQEQPQDDGGQVPTFISMPAARTIEAVLAFAPENARTVLESIASIDTMTLKRYCNDPIAGKYVMEPLMSAPIGAAWAKQRVIQKLKDSIPDVAENKFGWHVLRKGFDDGSKKDRTTIVKALAKHEKRIGGTRFGTNLLKHCKVTLYKKHPDQWESVQSHVTVKRKKQVLADLMEDLEQTEEQHIAKKKRKTKK